MLMRAILVRHGEGENNKGIPERKVDEYAALTEKGRLQILKTIKKLGRFITTNTVLTSPSPRTRQTAGIFAQELGLQIIIDGRLKEIDRGDWKGLLVRHVMEKEAQIAPEDRPLFRYPGGENWPDIAKRVAEVVEEQRASGAEQSLIVSHNHPILSGTGMLLGLPMSTWENRPLPNGGYIILHNVGEKWHADELNNDNSYRCSP